MVWPDEVYTIQQDIARRLNVMVHGGVTRAGSYLQREKQKNVQKKKKNENLKRNENSPWMSK